MFGGGSGAARERDRVERLLRLSLGDSAAVILGVPPGHDGQDCFLLLRGPASHGFIRDEVSGVADGVVDGLGCFVVGSYDVGDDAAIALQFVLEVRRGCR